MLHVPSICTTHTDFRICNKLWYDCWHQKHYSIFNKQSGKVLLKMYISLIKQKAKLKLHLFTSLTTSSESLEGNGTRLLRGQEVNKAEIAEHSKERAPSELFFLASFLPSWRNCWCCPLSLGKEQDDETDRTAFSSVYNRDSGVERQNPLYI